MTRWLVRRGMTTFLRDIEKDGDADLDHVYFEWPKGGIDGLVVMYPDRREEPYVRSTDNVPIHRYKHARVPGFEEHTITRGEFYAR